MPKLKDILASWYGVPKMEKWVLSSSSHTSSWSSAILWNIFGNSIKERSKMYQLTLYRYRFLNSIRCSWRNCTIKSCQWKSLRKLTSWNKQSLGKGYYELEKNTASLEGRAMISPNWRNLNQCSSPIHKRLKRSWRCRLRPVSKLYPLQSWSNDQPPTNLKNCQN